jgi:hypothetical protein
MPVTLATQEAEIRRTEVQSQPRQIVYETLSWKKPITRKGWWSASRCRPSSNSSAIKKKERQVKTKHTGPHTCFIYIFIYISCTKLHSEPQGFHNRNK